MCLKLWNIFERNQKSEKGKAVIWVGLYPKSMDKADTYDDVFQLLPTVIFILIITHVRTAYRAPLSLLFRFLLMASRK